MISVIGVLAVVGCDKGGGAIVESGVVTVTNVVEAVREVVVTNTVTLTVTNVVVEKRVPSANLSARKTAPYVIAAKSITASQLQKLLMGADVRTITCDPGAVALVEAFERSVRPLASVATVLPLEPRAKIAADAGGAVRVVPLSSIDSAAVAAAIKSLGGEVVQVTTAGSPAIRAKMSFSSIRKLAERGDVRRIERDEKK